MTDQQMYNSAELQAMDPEQFTEARARGFVKRFAHPTQYAEAQTVQLPQGPVSTEPGCTHPQCVLAHPHAGPAQLSALASLAAPPQEASPYAVTAWGSPYFDFVTPGGQRIQMQKLMPERMLGTGLLDKITRLPAFAQEAIDKAEGLPPTKLPTQSEAEQVQQVVEVVNELVPLVVVQPQVWPLPPEGEERVVGRIYVDSIELADRVAIMERAVKGVAALDGFRKKS